jgi:hypothetical protein
MFDSEIDDLNIGLINTVICATTASQSSFS